VLLLFLSISGGSLGLLGKIGNSLCLCSLGFFVGFCPFRLGSAQ
jgi:hypothetical protein